MIISPGLFAEGVFDVLLQPQPILTGRELFEFTLRVRFSFNAARLHNEARESNNYDVTRRD